ncbi:MAG: T9SS type A sorting domain-containing protein [Chlorobi bacterium]|nr:T9SS type A sorting domain-containing protein [Chlorobiota bacterium]
MKKFYFIFFFLVSGFFLHAQNWMNMTYTNTVTAIERSGTNWWVGTTGGLIRYDTVDKSVTLFNRGNSELPANYINDLAVDDKGTLWAATKNGLARYESGRQFSVFSYNLGFYSPHVFRVKNEKGKGLWVVTDSALCLLNGYNLKRYTVDSTGNRLDNISFIYPISPHGVIYSQNNRVMFLDHSDKFSDFHYPGIAPCGLAYNGLNQLHVMDGSTNGGFYVQTSQWNYYNKDNSPLPDNQIYDLKNDAAMNLYFLHKNGFSMKTATGDYWSIETGDVISVLENKYTTAIYPDTLGALGLVGGLMPYTLKENWDGGYSSHFSFLKIVNLNKSPLKTNDVRNLVIRKGKKYIGTRGVAVWDKQNHLIVRYDSTSTVLTNSMGPMDVDAFGRIWVADVSNRQTSSPGRFGVISHGKFTEIKGDSILGFYVEGVDAIQWETTGLSPDTTGILWISYWGKHNGIVWYDGKIWNIFPDTTYAPTGFTQFVTDNNGIKWFATMSGIYSYDGKKFTRYWNVAPIHQATCVAKDKEGNLWFGGKPDEHSGWQGGLAKFDGSTWTLYDRNNSLIPDMYVTSIAVDTVGGIWVGTHSGGILKMLWPHMMVIDHRTDSPLDNDFIRKIIVDHSTNDIWILNNNAGIFVYNEKGIISTGIREKLETSNQHFATLYQNYPNPFTENTTISYVIPGNQNAIHVELSVFNLLGQKVNTLVNTTQNPGKYEVPFRPDRLNPGIYFYRLNTGNHSVIKKMLLAH